MNPLRTISRRTRGHLREATYVDLGAVRIDTRALAAFRIAAGLLIVADVLLRARNFTFFYTESGVVPQSVATEMTADNAFSIYYFTTDPTVIAALFVLTILVAVQLIVGYRTRVAIVLSFLLVVSLDHHNPLVLSFADTLFRMLLFWAIFLPLGERWSVDALHADAPPRPTVASLASAAILAQIVYMYVLNGYHKRESALWTGGEATPLIMGLDNTTFLLGDGMRNVPTLLQYGGMTWYYMMLFAWLLVLLRGNARTLFVAMFLAGHASFAITVRIGAFPYVAIAGLLLFLQTPVWDRLEALVRSVSLERFRLVHARTELERLGSRLPRARIDSETLGHVRTTVYTLALVVAVVSLLVVPALAHLPVAQSVDEEDGPKERIDDRADAIRVSQPEWTVFAPHPRTVDRYYVFPAETEGGETVDAYNERPLTYERPHDELQKQFGTYRERFYMNSVRRGGPDDIVSETLAEHLCETWAEDHGEALSHVNMYYVVEDVTLETIDEPDERAREIRPIYSHGCGDNEPKAIDPPE
ncbi:HTTM domain-containing protein [Natrarchaeobius oligotrophus]|uniref:HTTM domain-containing protein n=1 Tax=Natrarchaeobius chitinivorans TaxID=1679083 RepID=A0A3N6N354_NATCH|nr:HTTM domain-containing protein [Natrarchaeobius chitinivorans]RQH03332.1 HTTM domain-containing protein [Natrarchaeobius chitinivorans]